MIEQSLQSHHTPISLIFKTLNPVESFSPLPLQYHIMIAEYKTKLIDKSILQRKLAEFWFILVSFIKLFHSPNIL